MNIIAFRRKKFILKRIVLGLGALSFLLAVFLTPAAGTGQEVCSFPEGSPPAPVDAIVEGLLDSVLAEDVPGAVVHISTPFWEGTWTRGTADLALGRPITSADTFRIASISKTFTAVVVLQLIDEEVLSLEDTLDSFDNGFGVPLADRITIRQLLNHTSGLGDWTESTEFKLVSCGRDPAAALLVDWSPQSMVELAVSVGHAEPGTGFEYEDTNYILLGMIVEWVSQSAVTGTRLPEEIRERILVPLALDHTVYPSDSVMPGQPVHGYWRPADFICPEWSGYTELADGTNYNPSREFGCGAMISTLNDLRTWCNALTHGSLISSALHREQLTWGPWPAPSGGYGLGIASILGAIGHGGDLSNGYSSGMYYLPSREAVIVVLLNSEAFSATALAAQLILEIFPPNPSPHPAEGDYNGDGKSDIALFRGAGGLWAVRGLGRTYFGARQDIPVAGDYDGDGYADVAVYRLAMGLWAVKNMTRLYFGDWQDTPVPGDYDGDGTCDIAVFHDVSGRWRVRGITRFSFGAQFDQAVPGDFNGDGTDEAAVFRPSSVISPPAGLWAVRGVTRFYYGEGGDLPIPGAYRWYGSLPGGGSPFGKQGGIFRSSSGLWAIRGVTRIYWGRDTDQPVPADYDGDSRADFGIFRDSSGLWAIRGISRVYFGVSGDIPVTR